jgi:hypothetical protein
MIKFKLNGKTIQVATSWDELTFSQYLRVLQFKDDYLEVVSCLAGIDYEILKTSTINGLESIISSSSFMNTPPVFPGYVENVGPYKLPGGNGKFNIQMESLAQIEDMRAILKTCKDVQTITEAFPKFVAIYVQKIRDGEYSYSKAMDMEKEIQSMPAKEVIVTGSFFYVKLRSLLNGTAVTSPPTPQIPKKSKRVLKRSAKSSGRRS